MFGKRYHLLTVQGISIGFDISWLFIAILLTWTLAGGYFPHYYPDLEAPVYLVMGIGGMLGLFGSVVLHELGHALTAKRFGLRISRITLFIFGGIAELKEDPPSPKSEFLVAAAGPLVSIFLSGLFTSIASVGEGQGWPTPATAVFAYLGIVNLIIVIFNLVPAFPLDGGRIFRSLLWWAKGSLGWATAVSSRLGYSFGFGLMLLGLFVLITGNLIAGIWWMILGLFLQQAAAMSQTQYRIKKQLEGEKVEQYMLSNPDTVPPDVSIRELVDNYIYKTYHHLYPVVEEEEVLGAVSFEQVKELERGHWEEKTVRDVMIPLADLKTLARDTDIMKAFRLFKGSEADSILVLEGGRLFGLLSAKDLFKVVSFKLELDREGM